MMMQKTIGTNLRLNIVFKIIKLNGSQMKNISFPFQLIWSYFFSPGFLPEVAATLTYIHTRHTSLARYLNIRKIIISIFHQ